MLLMKSLSHAEVMVLNVFLVHQHLELMTSLSYRTLNGHGNHHLFTTGKMSCWIYLMIKMGYAMYNFLVTREKDYFVQIP